MISKSKSKASKGECRVRYLIGSQPPNRLPFGVSARWQGEPKLEGCHGPCA